MLSKITISGFDFRIGGLVGHSKGYGIIKESYVKGSIVVSGTPKKEVGGLCGYCVASYIINSYAHMNISGEESVGGLVGVLDITGYLINAYSVGVITATLDHSPTVGAAKQGAYVRYAYWDSDVAGVLSADWGTGLTTSQMMLCDSYSNFDFDLVWYIQQNMHPILRWQLQH